MMNSRWIRLGLSLVGIAGVGVTSWLSVKGHEKAKDKTEAKEKLLCYAPAIASGVITAGCILLPYHLSNREIAALTASCGYLAANRKKIEQFIAKNYGQDQLKAAQQESAKALVREYDTTPGVCFERTGKGNQRFLFYEQGRYFVSDFRSVLEADRKFNYDISHGLIPTWNDYYEYLGITRTRAGEEYVIPDDICPVECADGNMEKPVVFDYVDWTDEYGVDVTLIFVDTTVTKLLKEF